jgi:hypothetical protein
MFWTENGRALYEYLNARQGFSGCKIEWVRYCNRHGSFRRHEPHRSEDP